MLVPLSRNPFPAGEKVVSRGKDYICQRCNAQEKSTDVRGQKLESKFRNLQKTKMFNLRKFTIIWPFSHNAKFNANIFFHPPKVSQASPNFKVRQQNPLLLDSYPSLGHLMSGTLPMNYSSFN